MNYLTVIYIITEDERIVYMCMRARVTQKVPYLIIAQVNQLTANDNQCIWSSYQIPYKGFL